MSRLFPIRLLLLLIALFAGGCSARLFAQEFKSGKVFYNVIDEEGKLVAVTYDSNNCSYLEESFGEPYCNDYSGNLSIPATVLYGGSLYRVTLVGYRTFANCTDLLTVQLPSGITYIQDEAFARCTSLERIVMLAAKPPLVEESGDVFPSSVLSKVILEVPKGSKASYRSAEGWRLFANIVETGEVLKGDADGNGEVDVVDVMLIVNAILGLRSSALVVANADVDGNKAVDVGDAMRVGDIILHND